MGSITFEAFLDDIPQMEEFFLTHPELFIPDPDNPDDQDDLANGCEIVRALNDAAKNQELARVDMPFDLLLLTCKRNWRTRHRLNFDNIYQELKFRGEKTEEEIDTQLGVEYKTITRLFEVAEPSDQEYEAGCRQLQRLAGLSDFGGFFLERLVCNSLPSEWKLPSIEWTTDEDNNLVPTDSIELSDEHIERVHHIFDRIHFDLEGFIAKIRTRIE